MDRKKASKEIMELFISLVNKYKTIESIPKKVGSSHKLYHSERHMLDQIGDHPGMNISDFARGIGVTKGAVSQIVTKLEHKGVITRYKRSDNDKEVFLELTAAGKDIYSQHKQKNEETLGPLIEELKKYPDEKIEFLIDMFKWLGDFLDQSKKDMKGSHD